MRLAEMGKFLLMGNRLYLYPNWVIIYPFAIHQKIIQPIHQKVIIPNKRKLIPLPI